jgi:hypothetical protein
MSENITPERLRCVIGASCPSIHRLADGKLLIVGPKPGAGSLYFQDGEDGPVKLSVDGVTVAVGGDEQVIIISPELLDTLKAEWLAEALEEFRRRWYDGENFAQICLTLSQSTKR